jgi:exodeoxyribonuclease-5
MQIRNGKRLELGTHGGGLVKIVDRANDQCTLGLEPAQIICGTNKKRWILTQRIRAAYGFTTSGPMKDERLIVLKNSRLRTGLVNGSIVYCEEDTGDLVDKRVAFKLKVTDELLVPFSFQTLQYPFEDSIKKQKDAFTCDPNVLAKARRNDMFEAVDWAWVITAHKAQGSQFDKVVVHDESAAFKKDAAKWAYTAVTRASDKLTIVL